MRVAISCTELLIQAYTIEMKRHERLSTFNNLILITNEGSMFPLMPRLRYWLRSFFICGITNVSYSSKEKPSQNDRLDYSIILNSTLRLWALPSSVSFVSTGFDSPNPNTFTIRFGSRPFARRYVSTAFALRCDKSRL
jgi:hypothetical protein